MIDCRYASLVAFLEARDTQLTLPFAGDDCGRQDGGRFGQGNNCAGDGGTSGSTATTARRPPSVSGSGRSSTANGFPSAWKKSADISHTGGVPGAEKMASLKVENPKSVTKISSAIGFESASSLIRFGAGDADGASVRISAEDASEISMQIVTVNTDIPVFDNGSRVGSTTVEVSVVKSEDETTAKYNYFQRDRQTRETIQREKASSASGESVTERRLGAAIMEKMLTSLEEAEKAGVDSATTMAAGAPGSSEYQGFRLWGRFGFDAMLEKATISFLRRDMEAGESVLSPEHAEKLESTGKLSLQELLSTKQGERWWKRRGTSMYMTLDFKDKESPGYKRYRKLLDRAKKAKEMGSRSLRDFFEFVYSSDQSVDAAEWRGFANDSADCRIASLMAFAAARNCGNGAGGFQKGNTCASGKLQDAAKGAAAGAVKGAAIAAGLTAPFPPYLIKGAAIGATVGAVKGLYDNHMQPTRVMQRIEKIGSSEKQVASLVKRLGGSPSSVAKVDGKKLVIAVKDSKNAKIFDVEMSDKKLVVSPSRKSGTLNSSEIAQVKKIASEHAPKEVSVVVNSKSPSYLAKLVKKGFKITANAAGNLIATAIAPATPALVMGTAEIVAEHIKKKKS